MPAISHIFSTIGEWLVKPLGKLWVFVLFSSLIMCPIGPSELRLAGGFVEAIWSVLCTFSMSFAISYVIAWLIYLTRQYWLKYFVFSVEIILLYTEIICRALFKLQISPFVFKLLLETNATETAGFLSTYFNTKVVAITLAFAFIVAMYVIIENKRRALQNVIKGKLLSVLTVGCKLATVFLLVLGIYNSNIILRYLTAAHTTEIEALTMPSESDILPNLWMKTVRTACAINLSAKSIEHWEKVNREFLQGEPMDKTANDSLPDIVFVVGESYSKLHSNLYGYAQETTPFQRAESAKGNLVAFTDMASISRRTSEVLMNIFSLSNYSKGESWDQSVYFPLALKKKGYDVSIYDNQFVADAGISNLNVYGFIYNDLLMDSCYTAVSQSAYALDGDFLEHLKNAKHSTTHKSTPPFSHLSPCRSAP